LIAHDWKRNEGKNNMSLTPLFRLPSFEWLIILWFVLGQLLMLLIKTTNGMIWHEVGFIANVAEFIPSVASVREAHVFDNKIAMLHYALMWLMSTGFCLLSVFAPIGKLEGVIFHRAKQPMLLAIIYVVIAVFNMLTNFYTGFYSFGLANFQIGFAVLSSLSTLILPYAIRFVFLTIDHRKKQ
jgi:hypothetical protein